MASRPSVSSGAAEAPARETRRHVRKPGGAAMSDLAEDDGPFLAAVAAVTDARWAELSDALDALDDETVFAEWAGGHVTSTTVVDGVETPVTHVPYPVYTPAVERLRSA